MLTAVVQGGVDFVVVGAAAAVLQGAPLGTLDLDIVHARTPDNVRRLKAVLDGLDAIYRHQHGRRLAARADILLGPGHNLFETRIGPLDALGALDGADFEALVPLSRWIDYDGRPVRVLGIETLIAMKRRAGRPKDLLAIPILERMLTMQPDDAP
ncbi:MAG: hypothetical protein H6747_14685 [Deltaproteobacteria bacterium]|nr:hypothetical protein [Deltaproteobacteria bacterium]